MRTHVVIDTRNADDIARKRPLPGDNELIDRLIVERTIGSRVAVRHIQHLVRARRPAKSGLRMREVMIGLTVLDSLLRAEIGPTLYEAPRIMPVRATVLILSGWTATSRAACESHIAASENKARALISA